MMSVVHPILVHLPLVFWPLTWLASATRQSEWIRPLVVVAWCSTLAVLLAGLWDEASARIHLTRPWYLDDHRALGILATIVATFIASAILRKPDARSRALAMLSVMCILLWAVALLGHKAVFLSPWQP